MIQLHTAFHYHLALAGYDKILLKSSIHHYHQYIEQGNIILQEFPNRIIAWSVGWLFRVKRPFETVFQSISRASGAMVLSKLPVPGRLGGGRVVRWFWVNFQCRGVLQFG